MTRNKNMRFLVLIGFIWITTVLLPGITAQTDDVTIDLERIRRATVFIIQTRTEGGRTFVSCVGSGSIVDRSGLIVTNAHNTVPNRDCPGDSIIIALNYAPDEPPIPTYRAEVAQANLGLDLALLRITQELSGRLTQPGTISLPFIELGNSSQVNLDNTVTVVGFPGIGDEPVEFLRGTINGFIAEPSGGNRSWMKTNATIPGTMSGGGVYNEAGQLIAIPTTVPIASLNRTDNSCVSVEDSNGDGLINRNDACIPIGGFINTLRPSNYARPLLRAASLGLSVDKLTESSFQLIGTQASAFDRLIISPSQTDGMPSTIVSNLPIGTNTFYLFFDYFNMTPETIYELRVSIDGIPNSTYSLAPVRWGGGSSGLWYISVGGSNQAIPNGVYELTLLIDGLISKSNSVIVGAPPQNESSFSNITFGIEDGENLFGTGYVLPTGNIANARFIHRNMPDGTLWIQRWLYNDREVQRIEEAWTSDARDIKSIRLEDPSGLPSGRYRLELYISGRLAATSDFTIAGAREGAFPRVFTNSRFVSADNSQEALTASPGTTFSDVNQIFALFDWEQLSASTLWTMRWSVDNTTFYEQTVPWSSLETGENFITRISGVNGIPDGTYKMELSIGSITFDNATIEAQVGIGQLPIDPFAQTRGVQLNGQILDAETREGIAGVSFILISEEFSIENFVWDADQVYTIAVTDRNGRFQLDRLMELGAPYSLYISADGYLPIKQDGVLVDEETANPLEVVVVLTRD